MDFYIEESEAEGSAQTRNIQQRQKDHWDFSPSRQTDPGTRGNKMRWGREGDWHFRDFVKAHEPDNSAYLNMSIDKAVKELADLAISSESDGEMADPEAQRMKRRKDLKSAKLYNSEIRRHNEWWTNRLPLLSNEIKDAQDHLSESIRVIYGGDPGDVAAEQDKAFAGYRRAGVMELDIVDGTQHMEEIAGSIGKRSRRAEHLPNGADLKKELVDEWEKAQTSLPQLDTTLKKSLAVVTTGKEWWQESHKSWQRAPSIHNEGMEQDQKAFGKAVRRFKEVIRKQVKRLTPRSIDINKALPDIPTTKEQREREEAREYIRTMHRHHQDKTMSLAEKRKELIEIYQNFAYQEDLADENNITDHKLMHIDSALKRGGKYFAQQKYEEAAADYTRVLAADPSDKEARKGKIHALSYGNDYDEMLTTCNEGLFLDKNNVYYHDWKIWALSHLEQYEEMLKTSNDALAIDNQKITFHHSKAKALYRLDRHKETIDACNIGITLDTQLRAQNDFDPTSYWNQDDPIDFYQWKAKAQIDRKDMKSALHTCEEGITRDKKNIELRLVKIEALHNLERYNDVINICDEIIGINKNDSGFPYACKAKICIQRKQYKEALVQSNQGLAIEPTDPILLFGKALALYGLGHPKRSIRVTDEALKHHPNDERLLRHKEIVEAELNK